MAKFSAGSTQPYFVLVGCGHISIRRMRPETAGVAFASDTPNGRPCPHCEGTEPATHTNDVDCSIDPDTDLCIVCGVDHSETCPECGRRGFHSATCGPVIYDQVYIIRTQWEVTIDTHCLLGKYKTDRFEIPIDGTVRIHQGDAMPKREDFATVSRAAKKQAKVAA